MPIYEYHCKKCDNVFEEFQKGFEERSVKCPKCAGDAERLISNTSFILKGTGWYVTDYNGKKNGTSAHSSSEGGSPDSKNGSQPASSSATPSSTSGAGASGSSAKSSSAKSSSASSQ